MICPLCGNEQPIAPECARCGVIFERMHTLGRQRPVLPTPPPPLPRERRTDALARSLRLALLRRPAPLRHRQVFFVQLARMLQSGVPLDEALNRIGDVIVGSVMARASRQMAADVALGLTLSAAMARQAAVFDEVERAVVAAAEHTGALPRAANRLATRVEEARAIARTLAGGALYPVLLITLSIVSEPLPILILNGFPAFLRAVWLPAALWLGVLFAALVVLPALLARPALRSRGLAALGRVPGLRVLLLNRRYALVFDVLAQTLEAGLPLARCLELAGRASGELQVLAAGREVARSLDAGATLAVATTGLPGLDSASRATIAAGERTGHLPETFAELAKERRQGWQLQLRIAATALGFLLTVSSALWVGYSLIRQVQAGLAQPALSLPEADLRELQRALGPNLLK